MTAGVHQAVTANAARIKAEGTDRWADLLKSTMPEGLVRDAILASPAWPDIAAAMGRLDAAGIDVARILTDAHQAGVGVDQAVAAVTAAAAKTPAPAPASTTPAATPAAAPAPAPAPVAGAAVPARDVLAARMGEAGDPWAAPARRVPAPAPAPVPAAAPAAAVPAAAAPVREASDPWTAPGPASTDAKRSWGPLTEGLTVPRDLDLGDRALALEQLKVPPATNSRMVSLVQDILPEREAGLLVGSRRWPLLAARMQQIRASDSTHTVAQHLNRLTVYSSWKQATGTALVGRLVDATLHSLTTPLTAQPAPASRLWVSPMAARSRSTTTPTAAAPGQPAPAEAAVPAHRQQAAPTKGAGRGR
ncbi:hypothetical protein [Streptomyces virginiae]|uniref:Uncharacterized protein n=2 Tax=Streptomyces virginiae TaxID=1961 RepID=A0ABZ1T6L0_STRVG|nr:hypothetical protein [Streptomyces virginiae]